nr:MAG TPA: hypothetical protein [Caudoviricetes sp.]
MGLYINNYKTKNNIHLSTAYALISNIERFDKNAIATLSIHENREEALKNPIERIQIAFIPEKGVNPYETAYKFATEEVEVNHEFTNKETGEKEIFKEVLKPKFRGWHNDIEEA